MPETNEKHEEVVGLIAACAVENGEAPAVRGLLRPEDALLSLYDRFVGVEVRLGDARRQAPPVAVDAAFVARLGLDGKPPDIARRRPPLMLIAAALVAVAAGAVSLMLPAARGPGYAPAGGTALAALPESLTLPDGEVLAARPDASLPQLPCRVFASAGVRAITCLASDGTSQTILLEP